MNDDSCTPLVGNWSSVSYPNLRFSTVNRTVGTLVRVSCDKPYSSSGHLNSVIRVLKCRPDRTWNDTLPPCATLQFPASNTTGSGNSAITTEVVIIWAVGGVMLLCLIGLLTAIICVKRKDSRSRDIRTPNQPRPISTIGLQNPGFTSIMDQMNHHCMITGSDGCGSQFTYPSAPPPYPGSLPRGTSASDSNNTGSSSPSEHINSMPRPQPPQQNRQMEPRTETTSRGQTSRPTRPAEESRRQTPVTTLQQQAAGGARPRDTASATATTSREISTSHRAPPQPANERHSQSRNHDNGEQSRRIASSHIAVPVSDILDPPPPYTPFPEYDHRSQGNRTRMSSAVDTDRRQRERLESIYI